MAWLSENWGIIAAIIIILVLCAVISHKLSIPSDRQIEVIRRWLLYAVIEAEKRYKSGTGTLKLHYVYDLFIAKFKELAPLISFDLFAAIVDDVLIDMRHILETNKDIEAYVNDD